MRQHPNSISERIAASVRDLVGSTSETIRLATIGVNVPDQSDRKTIYHYTSFRSFRRMLASSDVVSNHLTLNEFWATSTRYLNDIQEFEFGMSVISRVATHMAATRAGSDLKSIAHKDELTAKSVDFTSRNSSYCVSFSGKQDDLSQWRAYGDDGAGVCLEFDLESLLHSSNGLVGTGFWVVYGGDLREAKAGEIDTLGPEYRVARKLLEYVALHIDSLRNSTCSTEADLELFNLLAPGFFWAVWALLAPLFKHEAFKDEEEFRIVYSTVQGSSIPIEYRPEPLVPFVRLPMASGERLPLRSVTLGPANERQHLVGDVRRMLDQLGLDDVSVRLSRAPYAPKRHT